MTLRTYIAHGLADTHPYQNVAQANDFFGYLVTKPEVRSHISVEEIAVDSYQNLLFPILQYYTTLNRWPKKVTVISHDFKKRRFIELHCPAIRWTIEKFAFVGIDPPEEVISGSILARGEEAKGYRLFIKDPYGAHSELKNKRKSRGWNKDQLLKISFTGIPLEVKRLLVWTGGKTQMELYSGPLPWDGNEI